MGCLYKIYFLGLNACIVYYRVYTYRDTFWAINTRTGFVHIVHEIHAQPRA
jgi:hypothetical protein